MELEWKADEGELVAAIPSQLLQEEVFNDIDAIPHEQDHMTRERYFELGIDDAYLVPGHVVGPHCSDFQAG